MATKRFIIEVEEGRTECEDCPFSLLKCGREDLDNLDCLVVNLATMKIKEYDVPDCYDLQCEARIPKLEI